MLLAVTLAVTLFIQSLFSIIGEVLVALFQREP